MQVICNFCNTDGSDDVVIGSFRNADGPDDAVIGSFHKAKVPDDVVIRSFRNGNIPDDRIIRNFSIAVGTEDLVIRSVGFAESPDDRVIRKFCMAETADDHVILAIRNAKNPADQLGRPICVRKGERFRQTAIPVGMLQRATLVIYLSDDVDGREAPRGRDRIGSNCGSQSGLQDGKNGKLPRPNRNTGMKPQFIEDQVARQPWVKPAEKALDTVSNATVRRSGSAIKNFLHGVWLKHPLHPAVVEVPIGAFTTAAVLDLMDAAKGTRKYEAGADAAVGLGLITSSLAAITGLADWSHSEQPARRVGVLHATMNGSATLLYLASWLMRRRGDRAGAVGTGLVGWIFLFIGAFLGGRMVYNHKMGVDHAQREGPEDFVAVMPDVELPENEPHRAEAHGVGILLVKQNGKVFAIGERCAHLGGPLAEGKLGNGTIQCPWHGSTFKLNDGGVVEGPAAFPQPCYEARVRNGQIEVRFLKRA